MVYNATAPRNFSLADGHLLLSEAAALTCGYTPDTFASQRKLVLAYWAARQSGPLTFSLCNSGNFVHNFWVMTCPRPLETKDGADAMLEGCWCQLPGGHTPCPTSAYSFTITADTRPAHW
jgi:hypothetical protein